MRIQDLEVKTYIVKREQNRRPHPYVQEVVIHRCEQMEGPDKWAVRAGSFCLNKNGRMEYEPMPSSRYDEYLARCRFATAQEALDAFELYEITRGKEGEGAQNVQA